MPDEAIMCSTIHICCDRGCMSNNALQSCVKHFHHAVIQLIHTRIQTEIKLVNLANVNERESTASVLVLHYDQGCD